MGKFRSKLKGKSKGKRWQKGQSSNSNPKTQKYREMAKSRFFQENLGSTGLTQQAVLKHDAMMTYGHSSGKPKSDALNELTIAKDFENMSVRTGDDESETEYSGSMKWGTVKSFQTFASDWSQCSNVSFSKLLNRFDSKNAVHKDMLAILAAVTDVIKEQGGKESTTEYFAALMQTLKASNDESSIVATLSLLAMGIKSVPQAVLRRQFSDSASILIELLEKNMQSENGTLLRSAIGCLSVLLRAQEYALWGDSSTMKVFEAVLAFTLHSKPKVRKAAQHAVTAILRGSSFMIPSEDPKIKVPKLHPASNRVAEYCLSQIKAEALLSGHRSVLHILTMLRDMLHVFSKDYIKAICEAILSLMAHNNVYIRTCCMHTLHALLSAPAGNLGGALASQLARALLAARPAAADTGQVPAWAAVLQQALCCLARLDLNLCMPNLPPFVNICVSELWLSDVPDINAAATSALKAILMDCVGVCAASAECLVKHRAHVNSVLSAIGTGLDNPFNQALRHVIMTIAVCFEIGNEHLADSLGALLRKLNERKESHNFDLHKEVEHATGCAVRALGPEFVLRNIPIKEGDGINLDRSWLLPVLREKLAGARLRYFATEILELATLCRRRAREYGQAGDSPRAHTYDLLCAQLWALLPSFCNSPVDVKDSFKSVARVLGNVLKDNPEFRLSVMQALRKLIACSADKEDDRNELARFAKNYLPILLNIYMSPAKGSDAVGQRLAALETIQVYLTISEDSVRDELYSNALIQLEAAVDKHFQRESILDVIRLLVLYQSSEQITLLFDKWVIPLCETTLEDPKTYYKKAKKASGQEDTEANRQLKYKEKAKLLEMEHKKAYRILEEIFTSERDACKEFIKNNYKKIKKMLMSSLSNVAASSKAARLRCIQHLIGASPFLSGESRLVRSAVAEAVVCTKDVSSKCRQGAFDLISAVGRVLKPQEGGMAAFVELVSAGLSGTEPRLVSASVRALASVLYTFCEDLGLEAAQGLLERAAGLMQHPSREVVAAALSFVKVYTKIVPTEVLAGSLPLIFRSLAAMVEDCKRHSRLEIGHFLARAVRKFGAEVVEKLVPAEDEVTLRRLRNIRKLASRKRRAREQRRGHDESDTEADMAVKGTSTTLEDILKDSDSEMEYLEEEERPRARPKAKRAGAKAWIQDDADEIVDLADVSAARKITATDPTRKKVSAEAVAKKKDGGFRTAADGRLIISEDLADDEEPRPSGDIDSDTDDTDDESGKATRLLMPGAKRRFDDILSVKSGRSRASRASAATTATTATATTGTGKYRAGGRGIHRPLGSAASGAGKEYSSKKAKGDVKKRGKPDPYAYLPLSRKNLNKRKKAVTSKQFKGIVKSKTKSTNLRSKRQ
ncbi:unnamed protein product, partial [Iphiclides podalirius]